MSVIVIILFDRRLMTTCCVAGAVLGVGTQSGGGHVSYPCGSHILPGEGVVLLFLIQIICYF